MRLFYDIYSTRVRGEILLLGTDVLSIAAAILYATGAVRPGCDPADVTLFVLWACLPRALAKVVGNTEHTGRHLKAFGGSLVFVLLTAFLILAGWDLMAVVLAPGTGPDSALVVIVFFAWGTGFFLFHPRAYRLHDFLLLAVLLFGLKSGMPLAAVWLPIFFVGLYLSASIRHALHDSFRDARHRRLNIQNARALALVATAATLVVFAGTYTLLGGAARDRTGGEDGQDRAGQDGLTASLVEGAGGDTARGRADGSGKADGKEDSSGPVADDATRTMGFSYRIGLRDLALARFDPREVLRVSAPGSPGWRPPDTILWKGVTFSSFDPGQEIWEEETASRVRAWPDNGILGRRFSEPPIGRPLTLQHVVITPVFKNLVSPYRTLAYRSSKFGMYRENTFGDVFPSPTVVKGTTYAASVRLLEPGMLPDDTVGSGTPGRVDPRYSKVPTKRELDFDLRSHARTIFAGAGPGVLAKLGRLRSHFARNFRYSNQALWRRGESRLDQFLTEERIGDCTFFSTSSALLLRTTGVPTRLVVGFLGGSWDPDRNEVVIRNREAHAWIELWFPRSGWFPVNPTEWVRPDPSYTPPPDSRDELEALARRSTGPVHPLADNPTGEELPPEAEARRLRPGSTFSPDRYQGGRRSDPLDDESLASNESGSGDDEPTSWIQFGGYFQEDDGSLGGEEITVNLPSTAFSEGMEGARGAADDASASGQRDRSPLGAVSRSRAVRTALRGALAVLGTLVLLLVVRAFLKPRSEKKKEKEDDEEESGDDLMELFLPEGVELDERIPRDRVIGEYIRLQESLRRTRTHRRAHQTPLEHAKKVTRGDSRLETAFRALHGILYRIVYGHHPVNEEQADTAERSCRKIRKILG